MSAVSTSSTWELPSTSLRSHRCASLLWLPISLCLECALEGGGTDSGKGNKNVVSTGGVPLARNKKHSVEELSGFERRILNKLLRSPFVHMKSLRGVFPAAADYYNEDAVFEIMVRVASTVASFVASPWAEMEAHKRVAAVIVVLNGHDYDPRQALSAVKIVFQRYFKGSTCRCIVLDPTVEAQASMSQHVFVPAYTSSPVEDVAQEILMDIALSMVQQINVRIRSLKSSLPTAFTETTQSITEDVGMTSRGGEVLEKHVVESRLSKNIGDLLLCLGALDAALLAYHESLPGADALWCSATLESLAALRYMQISPFLGFRATAENLFSSLESDETLWNDDMSANLDRLRVLVEKIQADQRKATSQLKQSLPASPLNRRLLKDVEEPLGIHTESFRRQIELIRRFFDEDKGENMTVHMENVCKNARTAFKEILHVSFVELQLYLQEAFQQLRHVPGPRASLRERQVTIHLKITELFAEEQDKRGFLDSLLVLKASAKNASKSTQKYLWERIPHMSSLCGCWRKAVYYVVEAAAAAASEEEREKGAAGGVSISLLMRACRMAGIPLPLIEFEPQITEWNFMPHHKVKRNEICKNIPRGSENEQERHTHRAQDVPLLIKLLHSITETGDSKNNSNTYIQSIIASFLLFEYYPLLGRGTQNVLMDILERGNIVCEPWLIIPPPFLHSIQALPLPSHLVPRTIPLCGAQFTFIDLGRLKMTLLSLDDKLFPQGEIIWSVGTVGEVEIILKNPFRRDIQLTSIALNCSYVESPDDVTTDIRNRGKMGCMEDSLLPSSYVVTGVILPSLSKCHVCLQVQPNRKGYLVINGIEIRLGQLPVGSTFLIPSPKPIVIPVLQQLPEVSCILGKNEVEIFGGQEIHFPLYLTNSGVVTIHQLHLTVHDESCQLDICTGCRQRVNTTSPYVLLENESLHEGEGGVLYSLAPGDTRVVHVTMVAPADNDHVVFQNIVFRNTIELAYDPPVAPKDIPSAVPVFAVIPRRVQETYLRVFHVPSVAVTSLELSLDRRYVEITVKNKSKLHTIEILCSHLFFASIPDALIVSGAEYLIPPIEITKIPPDVRRFPLPWVVRELPECHGELSLDFFILANVTVSTEPLEDAVVRVAVATDAAGGLLPLAHEWESGRSAAGGFPSVFPAMSAVPLVVSVRAPWRRAVALRVRIAMENHLDAGILSGPVDTTSIVGGGGMCYEETVEFFPFKVGEHVLTITLSDMDGREMTHSVKLQVEHR